MKLIGIVGRKGAGKDTAAEALVSQGYRVAKFAGALKAMVTGYLKYIGLEDDAIKAIIEDYRVKEIPSPYFNGKSPRHVMQTLGTEWGRDLIDTNIWVDSCIRNCKMFNQPSIITDVRFPNEVQAVRDAGGVVIRISRGIPNTDSHASEAFIDSLPVDYEINNNGTINELHSKLLEITCGCASTSAVS
jgi:hypothetical protein